MTNILVKAAAALSASICLIPSNAIAQSKDWHGKPCKHGVDSLSSLRGKPECYNPDAKVESESTKQVDRNIANSNADFTAKSDAEVVENHKAGEDQKKTDDANQPDWLKNLKQKMSGNKNPRVPASRQN